MRHFVTIAWLVIALLTASCQEATSVPSETVNAEASAVPADEIEATQAAPSATSVPAVSLLIEATDEATVEATLETIAPTPTPTQPASATPTPTIPPAVIDVEGAILPPGFSMIKYASLVRPTSLTADQDGRIFATSQDGTIHVFADVDSDGRSDRDILFSFGFNIPLGIAISPGGETVFVSSNSKISTLQDTDGDLVADVATNLVAGLPIGLHQNDNLKFGPDGMLYMGIGSTCDACVESDPRSASLMRFDPLTGEGEIIATGLRNAYDLDFHPATDDLFVTDNGRDDLGRGAPQEELNLIIEGRDYGWPGCWDVLVGPDCEGTETAVAFFQPHSSANSIDFYTHNQFPPEYRSTGDLGVAYVALLGSWLFPDVETGIARVQLRVSDSGYQSDVSWLAQWPGGMPLGLIVGPDGALYVGDYINDVIYRISYGS